MRINSKKFNEMRAVVVRRNFNQNVLLNLYELDDKSQDYILKNNLFQHCDFQNSPEMISKQENILSHIYQIFEEVGNEDSDFLKSVVETQFDFAINLSPSAANRIVGVVKTDSQDGGAEGNKNTNQRLARQMLSSLQNNLLTLSCDLSVEEFGNALFEQLKTMIEKSLNTVPSPDDLGQSYYDLYVEASAHLLHCRQILATEKNFDNQPLLDIIKRATTDSSTPIILTGSDTCGKTTFLSLLATRIDSWLGNQQSTVCVIRYLGLTPRSMYLGEFLRSLCMQLSYIFGLEIEAKHCNFDVNKLFSWFESLLCAVQSMSTKSNLVILLDDLHLLKLPPLKQQQPDGSANGALAWLPFRLPGNVRIVCTMATNTKSLTVNVDRVLGSWKSTLDAQNRVIEYVPLDEATLRRYVDFCLDGKRRLEAKERADLHAICIENSMNFLSCRLLIELASGYGVDSNCSDNLMSVVGRYMLFLEDTFGVRNVAVVAKYLTCTRYGMTEVEMSEVCENDRSLLLASPILLHRLVCAMVIGGRFEWFPKTNCNIQFHYTAVHCIESGSFESFNEINTSNEKQQLSTSNYRHLQCLRADHRWASIRPIEELWFHLLHTGDVTRIKQATVCNLQFLQVAVQAGSICYVLGVLELVRTQILDIEIELVYHTLKLGTAILSKEPLQLASQIVAWIRRFIDNSLDNVDCLVNQALDWCKRQTAPLLAPINSWLWTPLPQQATVLCLSLPVASIAVTHDSQYVICTTADKIIHMYHVASRQLIRTFTGHKDRVCCVHVEKTGQYLVSGSEDTTVIVWDLVAATIYRTISEHFATVTCVATTQHDTVVISGSDDSRVIIVQLATGDVIQKLEHHRGSIVAVAVTDNDDVLVTGSNDSTVCVWSLDNFNLLNTIKLPFPVTQMDLSVDSTFLLVACEDSNLYLRSLATGSEIHTIRGKEVAITKVQIASDNCRASVAYEDNTVIVYDIHTTKCISTLICPESPVTGLKISSDDSFLFTASGEKITVWYFNRNRVHEAQLNGRKQGYGASHSDHVTCVDISKDGTMAISGSKDKLVKVWQLNQKELTCTTLEGHTANISCVAFAPNGLYAVSGSEDKTVRVWGLTLGFIVSMFKDHQARITSLKILADSRRILSADSTGMLKLWQADSCVVLLSCLGPSSFIDVTNNMRFAICGLGDNNLRIWTVSREDHKHSVSHSDVILCYALTNDSKYVITGSRDASLKIWDIATGRITQVLVGHGGPVTCVAVATSDQKHVVSGSHDCSVMIWDRLTGHNSHTLTGHTGHVTCVQVTSDGSIVISDGYAMRIVGLTSHT
uniref:Uncharacterized protein n=1 Tax=Strigamia maritima TaxID=126957 RepID=T1IXQ8_STRMM